MKSKSLGNRGAFFKKLDLKEFIGEGDPFSKLDLRVAKVLDVKDIPNADTLYILHLDVGKLGKRVIVAGMKPYYSKDEMKGKNIVIVSNLKPAKIRGIKSNTVDKFGDAIIKIIVDARDIPEDQWPRLPKWQRTTPQQDALVDICIAYMKQLAFENEISPGILCNRKDMEKLVMGESELPILQGWRKQLIGQPVLDLLQGKQTLHIQDNKIIIQPLK